MSEFKNEHTPNRYNNIINVKLQLKGQVLEAKLAVETAKEGIDAAGKALDLYNKVLDQIVPWKEFKATLDELDKYRQDYSKESADLLGEIKTYMMNGMDAYFRSTQSVYEWAGLSIPLLTAYIALFNEHDQKKSETQKTMLLTVLDKGIARMKEAQNELDKSSGSFNLAAGKLTSLNARLRDDFDEKSAFFDSKISDIRLKVYLGSAILGPFGLIIAAGVLEGKIVPDLKAKLEDIRVFYEEMRNKVKKAATDIDDTKLMLKDEIRVIGDLKTQTEETKTFVIMDDDTTIQEFAIESAKSLIEKCKDYRHRHIKPVH